MTSQPTLDDILLIILKWFKSAAALGEEQVIFADQRGDQPDTPYGTVKLLSGPKVLGHDEERQPDELDLDSDVLISGQRRILVSLNIYSNKDSQKPGGTDKPGALERMRNVRDSLELPTVYTALNDQGISINDKGEIQNLSTLLETTFQERAQLDITFGFASNIGDQPGTIVEVVIGGDGSLVTGTIDPAGIVPGAITIEKP